MSKILNTPSVLSLNAIYQRTAWRTVAEAFTAMMGGTGRNAPALALDIVYELDAEGLPIYDKLVYWNPLSFEDWLKLPIRKGDQFIHAVRQIIRAPTVIVCPNFDKTIMKKKRATPSAIRERDNNTCQYTGIKLTNKTFSLDHIIPRSRGGRDVPENLVSAHKDVNSKKGNAWNHEVGLKLLKRPSGFKPIPLAQTIKGNRHPDHTIFPNLSEP